MLNSQGLIKKATTFVYALIFITLITVDCYFAILTDWSFIETDITKDDYIIQLIN